MLELVKLESRIIYTFEYNKDGFKRPCNDFLQFTTAVDLEGNEIRLPVLSLASFQRAYERITSDWGPCERVWIIELGDYKNYPLAHVVIRQEGKMWYLDQEWEYNPIKSWNLQEAYPNDSVSDV